MKLNSRFLLPFLAVVVAAAGLVGNARAATYMVGDNLGWTVPSGGAATYATWASQHVFRVGDVLVFNFPTGAHDVAHVTRAAYDGCISTSPITLATVGPANFTLNSTGAHYYICTFGQHCPLGQKLAINVSSASATPAPAPAPPSGAPIPNPMPAPSQPPSRSPSMPPSPMSGSPSPTPSASPTPPSSSPRASAPGSNELSPGSNSPPQPFLPPGTLSPPPTPSSATTISISTLIVVFVSMSFGIMM